MLKKFPLLISIFVIILLVSYLLYIVISDQKNQSNPGKEDTDLSDKSIDNDAYFDIVDEIYTLSQKGKITEVEVVAGKSNYNEVVELYGVPERIDETIVGHYAIYREPEVTVGYQDFISYDLRSYSKYLQRINYSHIVDRLGEPDAINYYQDSEYNQIILIYQVNANYQLKWILNKSNQNEQDSIVDHISVVAMEKNHPDQRNQSLTITQLIDRMSIDEKIGQMIFAGIPGTEMNEEAEQLIKDYKVGGIILNGKNLNSPSQTIAYMNALKSVNRNNSVPLFFGIDQEGGRISKLPGNLAEIPSNMEIGGYNNSSFSFEIGSLLGKLVKAYGFTVNFAPVLDINSNPNNPVIGDRSFGNNPDLVSELGIQTMKGLQLEGIIPTVKHFPGHGDTSIDSHLDLPTVNKTLTELERLELVPFYRAVQEGADMVMIAHLLLPKIDPTYPSSLSKEIITVLLRKQIGYDGVVITDDLTMDAIMKNYEIGRSAVLSVKGGSDIVMVAHDYENVTKVISALKSAVENGEIQEKRINESVRRILELKEKYRIKDLMTETVDIDALNQQIESVLNQ